MYPQHSIGFCPVCGGGLLGIRVIDVEPGRPVDERAHGLIVCDECEAIWLKPNDAMHQYPNPGDARSPISDTALWGTNSRWGDAADVAALGWTNAVDPDLDAKPDVT